MKIKIVRFFSMKVQRFARNGEEKNHLKLDQKSKHNDQKNCQYIYTSENWHMEPQNMNPWKRRFLLGIINFSIPLLVFRWVPYLWTPYQQASYNIYSTQSKNHSFRLGWSLYIYIYKYLCTVYTKYISVYLYLNIIPFPIITTFCQKIHVSWNFFSPRFPIHLAAIAMKGLEKGRFFMSHSQFLAMFGRKKTRRLEWKWAMTQMGVEPKIGDFSPKMDGEHKGNPYEQMDDLGGFYHPYFWVDTQITWLE